MLRALSLNPFLALLLLASALFAGSGPMHKTLRAYGMGNAFVAVGEDKDAIYYNPAGLNLINRLGNYEKYPELGYYPNNFIDMRLNIGLDVPFSEGYKAYQLGSRVQTMYQGAQNSQNGASASPGASPLIDSLASHPELADQLNQFDLLPINISTKFDAEMALPHWGGAIWVDGGVAPYIEGGIITPAAGLDTVYIDAVAQTAIGIGLGDRWSVGVGYKMAKREYIKSMKVSLLDWKNSKDTLTSESDRVRQDFTRISTIGHALDFGLLYQWQRDIRFGASLRNWYFSKLGNENITPNLTAGVAYSPRKLQRNTGFYRKVNLAMDFEDMLNTDKGYKPLSHLDMGVEVEQVLLAVPDWPSIRFLKGRGSVGFKGGYPTAGFALEALRFFEIELCTWAEEGGYYTGEVENRYWVVQVSIGI